MTKEISCINAGFEDCEFLIRSENEEELAEFVRQHAEQAHDVAVSQEHIEKIMVEV